jgi:hypothetical protein
MANLTGFKRDNDGLYIEKDPDSNIQYGLDFTDYLNSGDSVTAATITIESITGDASPLAFPTGAATDVLITGGVLVNIRLQGGTVNNIYTVKCAITTTLGDTDARSFRIVIKEKVL